MKFLRTARRLRRLISVYLLIFLIAVPLAGCSPKLPLTLTISQPTDGATVTQASLRVQGIVSDPKTTVTINGARAAMSPQGTFGLDVTLTPGENTIAVVAKRGDDIATQTLKVTFTVQG